MESWIPKRCIPCGYTSVGTEFSVDTPNTECPSCHAPYAPKLGVGMRAINSPPENRAVSTPEETKVQQPNKIDTRSSESTEKVTK